MTLDDQRLAPRYSVHCRAALVDARTRRRLPVQIYDLSQTGAAISSNNFIVDEGDYELEFTVPGERDAPLRTPCRVARVMLSPDMNDFCAGLAFTSEAALQDASLQHFLARLSSQYVH